MGGLTACTLRPADSGWISLTDGKTLNGWRPEGKADWSVRNGVFVGRQGPDNVGGDLYTNREWADFELECEFKAVWPAVSGIFFRRSAAQPGYKVGILDDPGTPDTCSGSLYAMKRGVIAKNGDPKIFKKNGWNRLRILAVGEEIAIALNGKTVVKTRDSVFLKPGSIGIQVRPGKENAPMQIWVKKIRIRAKS
jgi:hypothetical protein